MSAAKTKRKVATVDDSEQTPVGSKKQKAAPAAPAAASGDEWSIRSYLHDDEWKTLLDAEFNKPYFATVDKVVAQGYKKNNVRPPKELVFNAFNSTSLKKVSGVSFI